MNLDTYLKTQRLTLTAFAERIGVTVETVRRYRAGERMPRPRTLRRIRAETGGQVTADDFIDHDADRAA